MKNQLELIPLDEHNKEAFLSLSVRPDQKNFIETPEGSLRDRDTHGWGMDWHILCITENQQVLGYMMHGQNRFGDVWFDRFMIDRRYQGKGYGKKALSLIVPLLKATYPKRRHILLSVESENLFAVRLYGQFGFRMAGYKEDGEDVMILEE